MAANGVFENVGVSGVPLAVLPVLPRDQIPDEAWEQIDQQFPQFATNTAEVDDSGADEDESQVDDSESPEDEPEPPARPLGNFLRMARAPSAHVQVATLVIAYYRRAPWTDAELLKALNGLDAFRHTPEAITLGRIRWDLKRMLAATAVHQDL